MTAHASIRLACAAMATRFELVLHGADETRLRAAGQAAIDEINLWHAQLSFFQSDSLVSLLNSQAHQRPVRCDPASFSLLFLCREVWRTSAGTFDPTIAPLMRAAGFRGQPANSAVFAEARDLTGFDKVELSELNRTVRFTRPGVALDLGAIGKGWAIDRAAETLRDCGIQSALLHGGTSSVLGIGRPAPDQHWLVAIGSAPDAPVASLDDCALGLSAPHGRTAERAVADPPAGHVLDPRTGRSASAASIAAVIGQSAALCDAWSTAALVLADRPAGLPSDYTSILHIDRGSSTGWQISGPHARTLLNQPPGRGHPVDHSSTPTPPESSPDVRP